MQKQLIAIIIVLFISQFVAAENMGAWHPKPAPEYEVKDDKILFRQGNAGLTLELANDDSIARYYSERGIEIGNPFPKLDPQLHNATIFLLSVINRTKGSVVFTPSYVTLHAKEDAFYPLDFTLLLPMLDNLDAHTKRVMQDSVFHSPETIAAGKVSTKFVIFLELAKKYEEMKLEFSYLYFEDKEINLNCYFTRKKN